MDKIIIGTEVAIPCRGISYLTGKIIEIIGESANIAWDYDNPPPQTISLISDLIILK